MLPSSNEFPLSNFLAASQFDTGILAVVLRFCARVLLSGACAPQLRSKTVHVQTAWPNDQHAKTRPILAIAVRAESKPCCERQLCLTVPCFFLSDVFEKFSHDCHRCGGWPFPCASGNCRHTSASSRTCRISTTPHCAREDMLCRWPGRLSISSFSQPALSAGL